VPAGLRDEGAADEQPRTLDQPQPDGFLESPVQAAGVAHRRETGVEGCLDLPGDAEGEDRRWEGDLLEGVELDQRQMDMRVEQPGH